MVENFHVFCGSFDNRETFTVKFFSVRDFKACEKDTCDMPFPSPSGLLKKQFNSAVIKEAK